MILIFASKYALGVNDDKDTFAPRQHSSIFAQDFGRVGEAAPAFAQFARFDAQRLVKRHGLQVLDGHFRSHRNNLAEFAEFAHGIVEDGGDDAAVAITGRAGIAFAQPKAAHETLSFLSELQAHAFWIVLSASEAKVFL